jgi:energy-coupling factor transport system permease protein
MKPMFSMNPITKIILILLVNILLFSYGDPIYLTVATWYAIFLIFLLGKHGTAYKTGIAYLTYSLINYFISFAPKAVVSAWGLVIYPLLLFMPLFIYAILTFTTTQISDLQATLQKLKVPNKFILILLVIFRFLPSLHSEVKNIRAAMKLKGVSKNPLKLVEHIYVPLLFNCIKIGDELSASAYTRGMGLYEQATPLKKSRFGLLDIISLCVVVTLICMRRGLIAL